MERSKFFILCCIQFLLENKVYSHSVGNSVKYLKPLNSEMTLSTNAKTPLDVSKSSDSRVKINLPSESSPPPDKNVQFIEHSRIKINLAHYDPKVYQLAYDVFIMNGNVALAFQVAASAVKHDPKNIPWREKLSKVALWSGNPEIALEQWLYFITHNIDADRYIERALTLAQQLNDFDAQAVILRRKLQKSPNDRRLVLQYTEALQNQGYPQEAHKILLKLPNVYNDREVIKQLVTIAQGLNEPKLQINYLRYLIKQTPSELKPQLDLAELLYSQGDIVGSYMILTNASRLATPQDSEFWTNYAHIALLSGNYPSALTAYRHLLNANKIDKSSLMELLNLELHAGKTATAYEDAKLIYKKYPEPNIAQLIVDLGTTLKRWMEVRQFIEALPPQQLQRLKSTQDSSILIALTYRHTDDMVSAMKEWERIFYTWPNSTKVQQEYLWFLMDNYQIKQLESIIVRWCKIFATKPVLWKLYAYVLTNTGHFGRALAIMKQHQAAVYNNYPILLNIADLYVQNDNYFAAYYLRRRAFYLLLNEITRQRGKISLTQQLALSELMRAFAPASMAYNNIVVLSRLLFTEPEVNHQVIAWSLEKSSYALTRTLIRLQHMYGIFTPAWMRLTLALVENDRDEMQKLLFEVPKLLPHRDRVTAALRTGNIKLAEEYAYQGLKEHPQEAEMYDLFTETMLPRANKFSAGIAQQAWGNVIGPISELSLRYFITPAISLTPYVMAWFPRTDDTQIFATTPSIDRRTGVIFRKYIEHGWWEVNLAERQSLDHFFSLGAKWRRENLFIKRLNSTLSLSWHDRAEETTSLLIGGMKDEVRWTLDYTLDSYNYLDASAALQHFQGQDESELGNGQELRFHWQHKFVLSYPDWNINLYGAWLNYQTTADSLSPLLQTLIPVTQVPSLAFYIPVDDVNAALTFGFGQQYRERYTKDWKLFAEAGILQSKALGFGQIAQGGVATSLFGRDHLVFYFEYTVNQQQVNQLQLNQSQAAQTFYTVGMSYDYYF
jgi:thioredoxin-like negative regulator of GroEL